MEPGALEFRLSVSDGAYRATDTVTVVVKAPGTNQPPVAADDSASTDEDVPVSIDVLANDTDPDGDAWSSPPSPIRRTARRGSIRHDRLHPGGELPRHGFVHLHGLGPVGRGQRDGHGHGDRDGPGGLRRPHEAGARDGAARSRAGDGVERAGRGDEPHRTGALGRGRRRAGSGSRACPRWGTGRGPRAENRRRPSRRRGAVSSSRNPRCFSASPRRTGP